MGDSPGLNRRQMIKASAVAGAAAWTAPMIVDSLTSPAAAYSSGQYNLNGGLSWAMCVFDETIDGETKRWLVQLDNQNCDNHTLGSNGGGNFGGTCHGMNFGYDTTAGKVITNDTTSTAIPWYPNSQCKSGSNFLFKSNNFTIDADPAIALVLCVAHAGQCHGNNINPSVDIDKLSIVCASSNSITFTCP